MPQIRVIKGGARGFVLDIAFLTLSVLALSPQVNAKSSSEQALRTRVDQLYSAYQQGDWARAEKYLTKDSLPIFRNQVKVQLQSYEIESIKLEASGDSAVVEVQIPVYTGVGPAAIPSTIKTRWRLSKGRWCLQLPDPRAMPAFFNGPPQQASPPPPSRGSRDLKFQSTWAGLGFVHKGEVKVARFGFTNVSQRVVTVAEVQTGGDMLKLKTQQKEFKPGEAGVFEFELNPSGLRFNVEQALTLTVLLTTEPEHAYTQLTIGAILVPGSAPAAGQ